MSPLSFILFLFLLPLSTALSSFLSLHLHYPPLPPNSPPSHPLHPLSISSLIRATSLKQPNNPHPSVSPLFPHSYGGYSLSLSLGSPPHTFSFLFDTASHLSWLPCSHSFHCLHCSPSPSPPPLYLPNSSLSSRLVGCRNPSCYFIHPSHSCPGNPTDNASSSSTLCPPYLLIYGSGSTGGLLMLERLLLPGRVLRNFLFGCSLFSDRQPPAGLAGFGRGPSSLPSQLGITSFAYCLISRKFDDDSSVSGSLFLGGSTDRDLQFIPFVQNPTKSVPFSVYYYLALRMITIGGKNVKLPTKALYPGPTGDGGTIIDSGTTFTYMEPTSFKPVMEMFTQVIGNRYNRSAHVESRTGLKPCFILPVKNSQVELPELVFHFKAGVEMRLPVENYFVVADADAVCLTVVTDSLAGRGAGGGPSIIIGSFQQQNYYMVYDLARERLGFRQQNCVHH
ncbi:aspartic proteinase nepenthesin-2 [Carex littledalei]|uniref:Aspartic proteinase nepenthesin-2 n=1 Tax=Carex littledalei TaxID=544730 RepID=A0A833VF52_9POAL|nr:aspartic proteinase nepenthesin-2 [Carex littledalei]